MTPINYEKAAEKALNATAGGEDNTNQQSNSLQNRDNNAQPPGGMDRSPNKLDQSFSFQKQGAGEDTGNAVKYNSNFQASNGQGVDQNRYGVSKKKTFSRGKSRPDVKQREEVQWFEEYHSFSLKASIDNRFRIRYAPIPREGSPWPQPQFYKPESKQFVIKPHNFKLHAVGEKCDILEFAFSRIRKNMFGVVEDSGDQEKKPGGFRFFWQKDDRRTELKSLNVTVLKECGTYPQYDMDESCE